MSDEHADRLKDELLECLKELKQARFMQDIPLIKLYSDRVVAIRGLLSLIRPVKEARNE